MQDTELTTKSIQAQLKKTSEEANRAPKNLEHLSLFFIISGHILAAGNRTAAYSQLHNIWVETKYFPMEK